MLELVYLNEIVTFLWVQNFWLTRRCFWHVLGVAPGTSWTHRFSELCVFKCSPIRSYTERSISHQPQGGKTRHHFCTCFVHWAVLAVVCSSPELDWKCLFKTIKWPWWVAISSIHKNAFLIHYIQHIMLEEITTTGLNVSTFKYICKHFVDLCWETSNFWECVFTNNYGTSLSFFFFFFPSPSVCLSGSFYMSKINQRMVSLISNWKRLRLW